MYYILHIWNNLKYYSSSLKKSKQIKIKRADYKNSAKLSNICQ